MTGVWALALLGALTLQADGDVGRPQVTVQARPDTLRVGDRFTLTVTVRGVGPGRVVFPTLPDTGALAALGVATVTESSADGAWRADYPMVAWDVGELAVPLAEIRVESDGDPAREGLRLAFPEAKVRVASVLPADIDVDTLGVKPARGVVGPNWSLTEKAAAAAFVVLVALIAGIVVYRRRGASSPPQRPGRGPARARAIQELDALAKSEFVEAGEYKAFYSELSLILRRFLAEEETAWSVDLTTAELIGAVARDGVSERNLEILAELLVEADLVKFARRRPQESRARSVLDASRSWVEGFERRLPESVEGVPAGDDVEGDGGPEAETAEPRADSRNTGRPVGEVEPC